MTEAYGDIDRCGRGPLPGGEISTRIHYTTGTMTGILDTLERPSERAPDVLVVDDRLDECDPAVLYQLRNHLAHSRLRDIDEGLVTLFTGPASARYEKRSGTISTPVGSAVARIHRDDLAVGDHGDLVAAQRVRQM